MPKMGDFRGKVLVKYVENPVGMRQIGANASNIYMRNLAGEITKNMRRLLEGQWGGIEEPQEGQFPIGRVTGELWSSIQTSTVSSGDVLAPFGWEISADVDYAKWVIQGNSWVPPRDFLTEAFERTVARRIEIHS